jgi:hypothetical protein
MWDRGALTPRTPRDVPACSTQAGYHSLPPRQQHAKHSAALSVDRSNYCQLVFVHQLSRPTLHVNALLGSSLLRLNWRFGMLSSASEGYVSRLRRTKLFRISFWIPKLPHFGKVSTQMRNAVNRVALADVHVPERTASYLPGLFAFYGVAIPMRTNNRLEQCFGRAKHAEQGATGATAPRQRSCTAAPRRAPRGTRRTEVPASLLCRTVRLAVVDLAG